MRKGTVMLPLLSARHFLKLEPWRAFRKRGSPAPSWPTSMSPGMGLAMEGVRVPFQSVLCPLGFAPRCSPCPRSVSPCSLCGHFISFGAKSEDGPPRSTTAAHHTATEEEKEEEETVDAAVPRPLVTEPDVLGLCRLHAFDWSLEAVADNGDGNLGSRKRGQGEAGDSQSHPPVLRAERWRAAAGEVRGIPGRVTPHPVSFALPHWRISPWQALRCASCEWARLGGVRGTAEQIGSAMSLPFGPHDFMTRLGIFRVHLQAIAIKAAL